LQPTLAGFARVVEARFVAFRPRHLFSLGNPRWVRFAKSRFAKTSVGLFGQNFGPAAFLLPMLALQRSALECR
jgi:hypothetical protein